VVVVLVQPAPSFLHALPYIVLQFLRFIILLSNMIPISLYVSLEVVKVFQCALLLNQDLAMYHRSVNSSDALVCTLVPCDNACLPCPSLSPVGWPCAAPSNAW